MRDDSGVTFLETLIAMILFGILVTIAVGPYTHYRQTQEHKAAARELVAFLRRAQVRAVSEETTYRVDIAANGTTATAYRFNGSAYVAGQILKPPSKQITYGTAAFVSASGTGRSVYFYARGAASKGSVTIGRQGSGKTYTVNVEGLTARVSYE